MGGVSTDAVGSVGVRSRSLGDSAHWHLCDTSMPDTAASFARVIGSLATDSKEAACSGLA